jgi:tetratricopeptide (TPR) repeat protein
MVLWAAGPISVQDLAAAQRRSQGRITGSIHLPRGVVATPPMIRITLRTLAGNYLDSVTLSDELVFRFHNVANGNYILLVEAAGHQPMEQDIEVTSYMRGEETFVVLTLGPPVETDEPPLPPAERATVTTDDLAVPEKAREELRRARRESQRNNPDRAVRHLRNALEVYPQLPEAHNSLAIEYLRLGKPEEALSALEKSIELDPDRASTHRNIAQLYLSRQQPIDAINALERSLELEEVNGFSLMLLGEAYLALNEHGVALEYFESASRIGPEAHSHLGLGRCYLQLGRYEEALVEFRGFLENEPEGERADSVRHVLALIEKELGR